MLKDHYITNEEKLCSYISIVGELYSANTTRGRLNWFKENLYFCSSGLSNPMFLSMARDSLAISDELMNINELMYKFMCNKKHNYLNFNILENIASKYDSSSFTWNIPDFVVPFLTAFILASNPSKKDGSTRHFFERLDEYFKIALGKLNTELTYDKEKVSNLYQEWTNEYLGRQYFCTLDILYDEFTNTSEQKRILRESVYGLTRILIECPVHPSPIPAYVNRLLKHYQTLLLQKAHVSSPISKDDLYYFYKHDENWKLNNELDFIMCLVDNLSKITHDLGSYINDYFKENGKPSIYKISVNQYDTFQEKYWEYLRAMTYQIEHLEEGFRSFFETVENTPSISQAVNARRMFIDETNKEKHIKELSKLIAKYYAQIQKAFIDFLGAVCKASGKNPEKYSKLTIEKDYRSELDNSVMESQERLSENIERTLSKLPDILYFHNPGYVQSLAYPVSTFHENDILRITYELTENYSTLSKEYLIHHFENKGLVFPVWRPDVITFLLNFDQMIDGL